MLNIEGETLELQSSGKSYTEVYRKPIMAEVSHSMPVTCKFEKIVVENSMIEKEIEVNKESESKSLVDKSASLSSIPVQEDFFITLPAKSFKEEAEELIFGGLFSEAKRKSNKTQS